MINLEKKIDKYTRITSTLAASGQPAPGHFDLLNDAGFHAIVHLQFEEVAPVLEREYQLAKSAAMLYNFIPVSYDNPQSDAYYQFEATLNDLRHLNVLVHCTMGYCTSAMLIPYLTKNLDFTLEDAVKAFHVQQFDNTWTGYIKSLLGDVPAQMM